MKFIVLTLLSIFVVTHGAESDAPPTLILSESLFDNAWKHHEKLLTLHHDMSAELHKVSLSVTNLLGSASNRTLAQVEENFAQLLAQDQPARSEIFALESSSCGNSLRTLIDSITKFTGFESSNCISNYDEKVQKALEDVNASLKVHEASADALKVVVRSFIGKNVFSHPDEIEERLSNISQRYHDDWESNRPNLDGLFATLTETFAAFNADLDTCHQQVQFNVAPAYVRLSNAIAICEVFHSTSDPFAIFR